MIFHNGQACIIVLIIVDSTCFYVLGLIAKTQQGVEILSELNWEGVISPNGAPEGLCVPQNLALFLAVRFSYVIIYHASPNHHVVPPIDPQLGIYPYTFRSTCFTNLNHRRSHYFRYPQEYW